MTVRLSTGLRTNLAGTTGFAASFVGGVIDIYSGSQPVSADAASTGTRLGRVSLSSGTYAPEILGSATLTLSGASGSLNTVTVAGMNIIPLTSIPFTNTLDDTAALLAAAITRCGFYTATSAGAVVTVRTRSGVGNTHNGLALAAVGAGISGTSSGNITGGVAAAAGLQFLPASNGAVGKAGTWSFNGDATGTAGWFRMKASVLDSDGLSSTTAVRLDGSIAVSGADLNLSNINIAIGSPNTLDSFMWTQPAG